MKIISEKLHMGEQPPTSADWKARRFGLGDLVAIVAEPIAAASDAVLGTKLVGCGGCKKRRETLNRVASFTVNR